MRAHSSQSKIDWTMVRNHVTDVRMDGKYTLTRKGKELTIELASGGVKISGPDGIVTLAANGNAKGRFDAELLEKLEAGWEIADVETGTSRAEAAQNARQNLQENAPEPKQMFAASVCVKQQGCLVVDLDKYEGEAKSIAAEEAALVLRSADCASAKGIYIHDAMPAEFDAHGSTWYSTVEPWCTAIGAIGAQQCKRLVIDTHYQTMTRQASTFCGDLTALLNNAPALEQVYVAGYGIVSSFEMSNLKEFRFIGEGLSGATLSAVLQGHAPKLETLALGLAYEQRTSEDVLQSLIRGLNEASMPSLRQLFIATTFIEDHARFFADVAKTRLVKQLDTLFVDTSSMSDIDDVIETLIASASSLRHLRRLIVSESFAEAFVDEAEAHIREALPTFEIRDHAAENPFSPDSHAWLTYKGG